MAGAHRPAPARPANGAHPSGTAAMVTVPRRRMGARDAPAGTANHRAPPRRPGGTGRAAAPIPGRVPPSR
ncbi:hypothetical protein E2C01_069997 [Portunus trituberculatus]|uniref:Uncharacterized protein n=1 Tax=Portunus trituberculatus TaxID=210409 RepID=A0A5B7I0Y3_PORTR|nr:hypothetical protein [Portunus trituberculatus]